MQRRQGPFIRPLRRTDQRADVHHPIPRRRRVRPHRLGHRQPRALHDRPPSPRCVIKLLSIVPRSLFRPPTSSAAASSVDREPLTAGFTGILGLALQPNSLIAAALPPTLGDDPDGAPPAANVFGLTPASDAPAARFVSLALGRPGSEQVASQLGIGRHPGALVPDPSKVNYSRLVADRDGARFWKTSVRNVSVWVGGEERVIDLPRGGSGGVFPSAVLDSGVPVILVRSALANAIYGALGIGPGSDGQCASFSIYLAYHI